MALLLTIIAIIVCSPKAASQNNNQETVASSTPSVIVASTTASSTVPSKPIVPVKPKPVAPKVAVKKPLPTMPQVLLDIAWCESRDRQFEADGVTVLHGRMTADYGRWQINKVHLPEAKALGIDIYTEAGNAQFALLLYNRNGTRDWNASRHCWSNIAEYKAKEKSSY